MKTKSLTRTELYTLVWQKPITRLAEELELSDVGLAKICRKYDIPRPERGYWSKLKAGHKITKPPLPAGKNQQIKIDLEEGKRRREKHRKEATKQQELKSSLPQPSEPETHELGKQVAHFFKTCRQDEFGRIEIERKTAPRITASPELKDRVTAFLSDIAKILEAKGIQLKSSDNGLQFTNEKDILYLSVEEYLDEFTREPDPEERNQPRWTWKTTEKRPSGKLRIRISSPNETRGRCKWTETKQRDALAHLPDIVARMLDQFDSFEEKREAEQRRKDERAEQEREYQRKRQWNQHCERLEQELMQRQINLLRAAENFKCAADIENLVQACISKWGGWNTLSFDQRNWVEYARRVAKIINPLSDGYPDPVKDCVFDPAGVPVNGPYPETKEIPLPYALLEIQDMIKR